MCYRHATISAPQLLVKDVADVIAWEQAIAAAGISLSTLMNRAGRAVADTIKCIGDSFDKDAVTTSKQDEVSANRDTPLHVVICAGTGNNGGDGWVAAQLIASERPAWQVTLLCPLEAENIKAQPAHDAATKTQAYEATAANLDSIIAPSLQCVTSTLERAHIIVDALLGTGFAHDDVREPLASWIEAINHTRAANPTTTVVAVDCPSGLNAQTGEHAHTTIEAHETITMLAAKPGLIALSALPYVGTLSLASLEPLPET